VSARSPLPVVVVISGRGSNLQALIDAQRDGTLPIDLRAVVSNRPDAFGLERARAAAIPCSVVDHTGFADRESFDLALQQCIDAFEPALVVLAGFMRRLTHRFTHHYLGRMLNIHPSLLPAFPGLRTHERALSESAPEHGATVHFVTEELDGGPRVVQCVVPVLPDDSPATLASRVLEGEHRILPCAVRWFAEGRLMLREHEAFLDGQPLYHPLRLGPDEPCP
jgi:phosphoribosylglycinamide formyltransferase-1